MKGINKIEETVNDSFQGKYMSGVVPLSCCSAINSSVSQQTIYVIWTQIQRLEGPRPISIINTKFSQALWSILHKWSMEGIFHCTVWIEEYWCLNVILLEDNFYS